MAKKHKKLSLQETKESIPILKEFNKLSKSLLAMLQQKVDIKAKQVSTIKVWVDGLQIPQEHQSTINIQSLDIRNTVVRQKGKGSQSQNMRWEDDLKHKRRGIVL